MDACGRTGNVELASSCLKEMHNARIAHDSFASSTFWSTMIHRKQVWGEDRLSNQDAQPSNKTTMDATRKKQSESKDESIVEFLSMDQPMKGTGAIAAW